MYSKELVEKMLRIVFSAGRLSGIKSIRLPALMVESIETQKQEAIDEVVALVEESK